MATPTYTLIDKYEHEKMLQGGGDNFKMPVPRDEHNTHYRHDLAVGYSAWKAHNKRVFGLFTRQPINEKQFIGIFTGVNTIEERLDKSFESPNVKLSFKDNAGGTTQIGLDETALRALQEDVDRYSASLPIPVTMAAAGSPLTDDQWPQPGIAVQQKQVFEVMHHVVSTPRLVFHRSPGKWEGLARKAQLFASHGERCDLMGLCNHAESNSPGCNCMLVLAGVRRYENSTHVTYLFLALVALRRIEANEELRWAYGYNPLEKWKPTYNPGVDLSAGDYRQAAFHRNIIDEADAFGTRLLRDYQYGFRADVALQPVLGDDTMYKYATAVVALEPAYSYGYIARWVPSIAMQSFGTYTDDSVALPDGQVDETKDLTLVTLLQHIIPVALP